MTCPAHPSGRHYFVFFGKGIGSRCIDCDASADTRPQGGDATEIAAPFTSGAAPQSGETPK